MQGVEVVYVAVEEPDGATLTERFQRCRRAVGLPSLPPTLRLSDAISPHEVDEDLEAFQRGVVVLDSLTELRAHDEWFAAQLVRPGLGWVLVQHWTKGRAPIGGLEPAYIVDVRGVVQSFRLLLITCFLSPARRVVACCALWTISSPSLCIFCSARACDRQTRRVSGCFWCGIVILIHHVAQA